MMGNLSEGQRKIRGVTKKSREVRRLSEKDVLGVSRKLGDTLE